eukprot:m.243259 g.243259  ORF g.243259 m.243259 type:complete len:613 (-) comp27216_c0_seq1:82-1920(-)
MLVALLAVALCAATCSGWSVQGDVYLEASVAENFNTVIVQLWTLPYYNGRLLPLSKRCVYGIDSNIPAIQIKAKFPAPTPGAYDARYSFSFDFLFPQNYTVVAFATKGQEALDFTDIQPLGWYKTDPCLGAWGAICTGVVALANKDVTGLSIPLNYSHEPVDGTFGRSSVKHMNGVAVVQLQGNAVERGAAHGRLLARQVLEFFEFFLLEDRVTSPKLYETSVRPGFMSAQFNLSTHPGFLDEARAMVAQVCSTINCMVPSLGRPLDEWDIVALNGYGIWHAAVSDVSAFPEWMRGPDGNPPRSRACSQFILWGDATISTDTIHGRNMDGEIDVRKLTVSDFVLFAVTPTEQGYSRYVSAMWPGFIGTYSGINEHGWVMMDNSGCAGPRPYGQGSPIDTGVIRDFLLIASTSLPVTASYAQIQSAIETGHKSETGGVLIAGDILVMSRPFVNTSTFEPGCMYEGDHRGGLIRAPRDRQVLPSGPRIGATNHFYRYQSDPFSYPTGSNPGATDNNPLPRGNGVCNGDLSDFSTVWRFQAGCAFFEALSRAGVTIDESHMKRALASMAEAETEHSIIMLPNTMHILVAVASRAHPMWDAPYEAWQTFSFNDLFQ